MRCVWIGMAAASAALAVPAMAGNRADAALNALYESIAAGVAANSGDGVVGAFAGDAMVLDPRPGAPAEGAAFRAGIQRMAERLKADGVQVRADYRIVRRIVSGDIAVDTGFRRQTMAVSKPGAPQPGTQYHKFLVVAQLQADGGWKIVRDASLPASKEAWDAAVKVEGLKYDG
jgi:ketosteroid isomerase-like protein